MDLAQRAWLEGYQGVIKMAKATGVSAPAAPAPAQPSPQAPLPVPAGGGEWYSGPAESGVPSPIVGKPIKVRTRRPKPMPKAPMSVAQQIQQANQAYSSASSPDQRRQLAAQLRGLKSQFLGSGRSQVDYNMALNTGAY